MTLCHLVRDPRAWGYVAALIWKRDVSSAQAAGLLSTENCVVLGEY